MDRDSSEPLAYIYYKITPNFYPCGSFCQKLGKQSKLNILLKFCGISEDDRCYQKGGDDAGIRVYKYSSHSQALGEQAMWAHDDKGLGHVGVSGSVKKNGCFCKCWSGRSLAWQDKKISTSGRDEGDKVSGWRDGSVVKSTCCSSRGPRFNSKHPHGSS